METPNKKKNQTTFLWSLLIGTTALFVGLAIGLTIRQPVSSGSVVQNTTESVIHTDTMPAAAPTGIASADADTVAVELPFPAEPTQDAEPALPAESSAFTDDSVAADTTTIDADIQASNDLRRQQVQYLREVLPDNLMIPAEKSPQEVDTMMAEFEENKQLQARIESGEATQDERERYYALRMKKFDEEIALIQLCNDVAANSLASADEQRNQLCTHVAASSEERLQVINDSIEELQQQVLFSARGE